MNPSQLELLGALLGCGDGLRKCYANFSACNLDASGAQLASNGLVTLRSDVRRGDGRVGARLLQGQVVGQEAKTFAELADGSVDALICDLPSGAAHKARLLGGSPATEASSDLEPGPPNKEVLRGV